MLRKVSFVALSIYAICVLCPSTLAKPTDLVVKKAPRFLGEVNGKSFHLEDSVEMDWTNASDYCGNLEMTLASIETEDEMNLLKNVFRNSTGFSEYWVNAKEWTRQWGSVWNPNGTDVITNVQVNLMWQPRTSADPIRYCGTMNVAKSNDRPEADVYIQSYLCYEKHNGALCQKMENAIQS